MGKDVFLTKRNQYHHSTVKAGNDVLWVPDIKSNDREHTRIALHSVFASSSDESSAVCVVVDDTDIYILLLYMPQSNTLEKSIFDKMKIHAMLESLKTIYKIH